MLLDEPGTCFPDPTAVAITPDGALALVTSSSTDRVAVVDIARLRRVLDTATPDERANVFPNHLGKATEFVIGPHPDRDQPPRIWPSPPTARRPTWPAPWTTRSR